MERLEHETIIFRIKVANLTTLRKQKKSNDFFLSPSLETKKID